MPRPMLIRINDPCPIDSWVERRKRIVALGVDGVEWVLASGVEASEHTTIDSAPGFRSDADVEVGGGVDAVAACCHCTDVEAASHEIASVLETAAGVGAACINLTIPPIVGDRRRSGFCSYQDALNFAHDLLRRVRFTAERTGVVVAVEAAAGGCLLSPVELREMVHAVHSSAVGVCLDVRRVAMIGRPDDWLRTLRRHVQSLRLPLEDVDGALRIRTRDSCSLDVLASALDNIGYDRPVILDLADPPKRFPEKLSWLGALHGASAGT